MEIRIRLIFNRNIERELASSDLMGQLELAETTDWMRRNRLQRFGHIEWRELNDLVKGCMSFEIENRNWMTASNLDGSIE